MVHTLGTTNLDLSLIWFDELGNLTNPTIHFDDPDFAVLLRSYHIKAKGEQALIKEFFEAKAMESGRTDPLEFEVLTLFLSLHRKIYSPAAYSYFRYYALTESYNLAFPDKDFEAQIQVQSATHLEPEFCLADDVFGFKAHTALQDLKKRR